MALPDDFGGLEDSARISLSDTSSSVFAPIDFKNPGQVQQMFSAYPSQTGRPQVASLRPLKRMPENKGQRHELFLFPTADAAYTLTFSYYILPGYLLDVTMPYAYGGAEHSETIKEACLAVAEQRRDDAMTVHSMMFDQLLAQSIRLDRRKKASVVGYNRDLSDCCETSLVLPRGLSSSAVTVNGVEYS